MASKPKPEWKSVSPPIVGEFHVIPRDDDSFGVTGHFGFIKLHDGGRPKTPAVLNDQEVVVKIDPRAEIRFDDKVIYDGKRVGVAQDGTPYHLNRDGVRKVRRKRRKR